MNEIQKAKDFYNQNRARVYVFSPRTAAIFAMVAFVITVVLSIVKVMAS